MYYVCVCVCVCVCVRDTKNYVAKKVKDNKCEKINMKKLILTVILMITTTVANAQGVITVKNGKSDVPVEQWYVIRDKDFMNYSFFYAEHDIAREELKRILNMDDQSIEFPKGKDKNGDNYWIIMYENEFTSYIYISKDGDSEYTFLTITTD